MASSSYAIPNIELLRLRKFYDKTDQITLQWGKDWQWLVDEYGKLHDEMSKLTDKLDQDDPSAKKVLRDKRTIKPIPESVNHEYGWLLSRDEFRLDKYGPDMNVPPMLPEYKIFK